jgi:hypothetical protein
MAKEFIPVNELLEQTTLQQFVDHYNFETKVQRKGNEERIRNPFACEKCSGNQQAVSVNWAGGVYCGHCYHCSVKGRISALLFGMKYGRQPTGGKLKGEEFKDIAVDIATVAGLRRTAESETSEPIKSQTQVNQAIAIPEPEKSDLVVNPPLARNPDERIAKLVHLSNELLRVPSEMSARAQNYLSSREYMTTKMMERWDVGYLPSNSKSMLRGKLVYALRNERSEKIGYIGRDLAFEDKLAKWENGDRSGKPPIKTKFPPGFVRGSFLYGAERSRLETDQAKLQLRETGIIVVEGPGDVIALDCHGVLAVGVCSNRLASGQIEKLVRWSKSFGNGKITLMLDNDKEGYEGAIESIQKLALHIHVSLAWTPDSHSKTFVGKQPENLSRDNVMTLLGNGEIEANLS